MSFRRQAISNLDVIMWWSRGESNPRPKADPQELLRAQYCLFRFPCRTAGRQAVRFGIPLCSGATGRHHAGRNHCITPDPRPWSSAVGRRLIKPRKRDSYLRLDLKFGDYRGPALCPLFLFLDPRRNLYDPISVDGECDLFTDRRPSSRGRCRASRRAARRPPACRRAFCRGTGPAAS